MRASEPARASSSEARESGNESRAAVEHGGCDHAEVEQALMAAPAMLDDTGLTRPLRRPLEQPEALTAARPFFDPADQNAATLTKWPHREEEIVTATRPSFSSGAAQLAAAMGGWQHPAPPDLEDGAPPAARADRWQSVDVELAELLPEPPAAAAGPPHLPSRRLPLLPAVATPCAITVQSAGGVPPDRWLEEVLLGAGRPELGSPPLAAPARGRSPARRIRASLVLLLLAVAVTGAVALLAASQRDGGAPGADVDWQPAIASGLDRTPAVATPELAATPEPTGAGRSTTAGAAASR